MDTTLAVTPIYVTATQERDEVKTDSTLAVTPSLRDSNTQEGDEVKTNTKLALTPSLRESVMS